MLLKCIVLLFLMHCLAQDLDDSGGDVEVVSDHEMMESHGDHQEMVMAPMDQDDPQMVMMSSQSMHIRPPPVSYVQLFDPEEDQEPAGDFHHPHPHHQQQQQQQQQSPPKPKPQQQSENPSKEQYCLNQMTKCLANPLPFQNLMMSPAPPSQPSVQASAPEGVTVDPPPSQQQDGDFETFDQPAVATGVNAGKITWMKKKPHTLNFMEAMAPNNSPRCSSQTFIRMQECCSNSPGQFFNGAILYACSDLFPINPGIVLQEYNLNMGQLPDSSIDLSRFDTFSGETLGNGVCFMECLFRKRFLISEEGTIDYTMVAHHYMSAAISRSWHPVLMQAIRNCSHAMHMFPARMKNPEFSYQRYCYTHPYLFQQCIRKSLHLNCPVPKPRTDTPECMEKKRNLMRCDVFQRKRTVPRF